MANREKKETFKTSIGGQALIEGVMMRGPTRMAIAVWAPGGRLQTEVEPVAKNPVARIPLVRGVYSFISSLLTGYKTILRSAEISMTEEEKAEEESALDRWLKARLGEKGMDLLLAASGLAGGLLAIVLFLVAPTFLTGLLDRVLPLGGFKALVEGCVKLGIFLLYLFLISRMKEIARLFRYHGAEHKTIAAYEAGRPLTVENVRESSRFHPRCGTSFLLLVLVVSILVFSWVPWRSTLARAGLKLLLLPVVMGVSYELIRFAGRHDDPLTRAISAPGLWLQRLTTAEPDDDMIRAAIAAFEAVLPGPGEEGDRL